MNGVGVHIMDYHAGDPGSVPEFEPPITQCSKQLQRNGVHANDFNNFVFKKLQEEKRPF